jgi:hypothetical protein
LAGSNAPMNIPGLSSSSTFFSVIPGKGHGGLVPVVQLTGSQRIIQNQLNGIILNGVKAGRNIAVNGLTSGAITGTAMMILLVQNPPLLPLAIMFMLLAIVHSISISNSFISAEFLIRRAFSILIIRSIFQSNQHTCTETFTTVI